MTAGALKLAFHASDDHARSVSEALGRTYPHLGLVVTIDDEVAEGLPQLPCATCAPRGADIHVGGEMTPK
ncbi:hypothetical protein AB0M45_16865 [Nocardia sp. NPDC051787]|uniref:hypothetical protein n=1 Tax=Nocardia sp. NPDC051787 TaxID=3155415 RepID=UPI003446B97D